MNAWRTVLLIAAATLCGTSQAGVFVGASTTGFPTGIITHPKGYSGSGTTAVSNTVCFNPSVLPSGVTETQVDNAIKKAVATWNAKRYGQNNYTSGSNTDITAGYYDFESAVLHEIGHCIGLGHPNVGVTTSHGSSDSTASRPDAGNSYDLNAGSDGIYGSRDDNRGDNTNLYWFYPASNDPLAYPSIIDATTFTQATGSLPSGSTWPANATSNVTAALGYSSTRAVMTWVIDFGEARRRPTAEDMSTLKLAMAGKDGTAGNSDDYNITLVYDSSVSSCDIPVNFSSSTSSLGVCTANAGGLNSVHYVLSSQSITFSSTTNWYFSQSDNTTTTITSDTPDPSTVNNAYTVGVSVARNSSSMTGAPSGSVLVSDGSATCTATLSGSTSPATGSCSLTSTTTGSKTLTATYLGYQGFDSSSGTATHTVNLPAPTVTVSDTPDPTNPGVAYTVSFSLSGSFGTPTGTVSVSDGAGASCGPVTLVSGAGSCSITSTKGGGKTLTATYGGDSNYSSTTGTTGHTVNYLTPTITVTDTPDPSVSGASYSVGVTVSGTYTTPTSFVTIDVSDGHGCSITLSSGTGSCTISSGTRGTLTINADYNGDNVYNAASTSVSHTVKDASTTSITGQSPSASTVGQAYTVSVSVANSSAPATTPTGTVTISDGSASCTATLASGAGSCALTSSTVGTKTLTATYNGDTNVGTSSATASHTVSKGTPTVTVTDATDPSGVGVGYAVSVSVALSGGATATGSVSVSDGSATCSIAALSSGSGSCNLTSTTAGSKTLTATYNGDSNYNSTTGNTTHTVSKGTPTVTVNHSPTSSSVGQAYTVSFSVALSGGAAATGSVSVSDGTDSCSGTLTSGSGSCSLTSTTVGSKTLTASYAGDSNYNTASGTVSPHTVGKATPTVTVTDATDPSGVGVSYVVSVSVAFSGGATATGSVSVSDGSATCSIASLSSGSGSCNLTSTTAGAKTLTATYNGDSNYNGTSGSTTHTVSKGTPTVTVGHSPTSSQVGQSYTVSFSVALSGGATASGSVSVSDGTDTCSGTLTSGSGSCSMISSTAGSKTLTASYSGDGNYNTASGTLSHTVSKVMPTVGISDPAGSSTVGQAYTITSSVHANNGATATGTVTISEGSVTCTITLVNGTGSCSLTSVAPGSKTLSASYGGDSNYNTGSATLSPHVVSKGNPTVTVSDAPDPSTVGAAYAVSVSVAQSGGPTPTGSVSVSDGSATCSIASLGSGSGSCNLTSTSAGSKTLTATYSGDSNYNSTPGTTSHTVNKATANSLTLSDAPDPSVVGAAYTVSVALQSDVGTPTGTVTVSDGSASCTATLSAAAGSCQLVSASAGSKTLSATYNGDSNYNTMSTTAAHTVNKGTPSVTVTPPGSSVPMGTPYAVDVSVALSGGTTATGSVSVSDGSATCTIASLSSGSGSCNLTSTSAGTRTLTATYSGDGNYNSASGAASYTVGKPVPAMAITSDTPDPSVVNGTFTVSFSVTSVLGTPTGTVTVNDGSGTTCSGTLNASGIGSCSMASTTAGVLVLAASYPGDANFASSSATESHTVNLPTPTVTITDDTPDPSELGAGYTVSVSVSGSNGIATGSVTVHDDDAQCQVTLVNGSGSCVLTSDTAGTRTLAAEYGGDANYVSASGMATHTVLMGTPAFDIQDSPDPSALGSDYNVQVGLSGLGVAPSGQVSVSDGSSNCVANLINGNGTCALHPTLGGTATITVSYAGDGNYNPGSATTAHTVELPVPTLAITAHSPNPSDVATSYTVAVQASGSNGTPTGTVTVRDGNPDDDGTAVCTITLASGSGSCTLTSMIGGTRNLRASYPGDANYQGAGSAFVAHTVSPIAPSSISLGQSATTTTSGDTYHVTVSMSHVGGADGIFGSASVSDGNNSCTAPIYNGSGGCDLIAYDRGTLTLTAQYGGSNTYLPASTTATHTVVGHGTTTTITAHSPDPTPLGSSYSVSVTVASSTDPSGSVSISDGAGHTCSAQLSSGAGSCSISASGGAGTRTLTATFAGDDTHEPSSSSSVSHSIGKGTPTLAITTVSPDPASLGSTTLVSVQVSASDVMPTGSVQVGLDGQSCSVTLNASGVGSCSVLTTQSGPRTVNASYGGDGNYFAASASHSVTVGISDRIFANGFEVP